MPNPTSSSPVIRLVVCSVIFNLRQLLKRFPTNRKISEKKRVTTAVGIKDRPAILALKPIPILLADKAQPKEQASQKVIVDDDWVAVSWFCWYFWSLFLINLMI